MIYILVYQFITFPDLGKKSLALSCSKKFASYFLSFCSFYANEPEELVNLQRKEWQPLIDWFDMK